MDLANATVRIWRLCLSVSLDWEQPEQPQDGEPMGFAPATVEAPDIEEDDDSGRLGFG
jgi:hypothetical protein